MFEEMVTAVLLSMIATDDVVMVVDDTVVVVDSDGVPHSTLKFPFCSPLNPVKLEH